MATYSFNGKTFNFPDDVSQEEALQFIDQQSGGSNAPTTPQEAPQEAQPQTNPTTQPTTPQPATEPQAQPQSMLDQVGNTAAGMGRILAGGVAGLANAGIGAVNTVGQAVQTGVNAITGETEQYTPIAPAGYGELDQYLMPRGKAENLGSDMLTFAAGGELVAPLEAATGAGFLARTGTQLANNAVAGLAGSLSKHTSGNESGDVLGEMALNSLVGAGMEKVGGAFMRNLPAALGGLTKEQKAAVLANPEFINKVLQNGDESAQQAFRTATTDEAGNSILTPSQVFNTGEGRKYIAAEQRDLTRGSDSAYQPRIDAQTSGDSLLRAVDEANPALYRGDNPLQTAAQDTTQAFKDRASQLYNESKTGAQQILDNAPVKITNLKMPETKAIADTHLADNAATGNIKLTADARRTLTQFNKAEIKSVDDLDVWKRTLNEKAQKAYRAGDFTSYNALNEVKNNLRNEADSVLTAIDPQAGSLYRDADSYYSVSVGDFGNKSVLGKISDVANPDTASKALLRGENALYNTKQVAAAISDAIDNGSLPQAQVLAQNLAQGLGSESRAEAARAATMGENFSPTKFINSLNKTAPQVETLNPYSSIDESQVNNALADSIRALRERLTVPQTNSLLAQAAGRTAGGVAGAGIGGPVGALVGQEVGGRVTNAINKGVLDRLFGTAKKGNKYIDYLSDPANAQKVAEILNRRGASFDDATSNEIKGIIDNVQRNVIRGETFSLLHNALNPDQEQPEANPLLPTLPSTPATQAQSEPAAPEPEQQAQAARPKITGSRKAIDLYKSLASAETGGLDNRFIRTKASEGAPSTAYGPAQITYSLAKDFASNHPELFTDAEKEYLDRFVEQGQQMLHADKSDPVYGYGGTGTLGETAADRRTYAQIAIKMLDYKIKDNNGSLDKTVKAWRGANDSRYFAKVRSAMQQERSKRTSKRPAAWVGNQA
ncbi:hypothetical protein R0R95_004643 [Salmonella enterica]|nr:hypothetical protein [Salmonella enterica]